MIPKKIHYCWFGGKPLSVLGEKCLASWKNFCPGYEIIRWDESNCDVGRNLYMKQAYDCGKWGFVSDVARMYAVYEQGGIYLDTDVEIIKPFDDLLEHRSFFGVEEPGVVAVGLGFGAVPGNETVGKLLQLYDGLEFVKEDGSYDMIPCPVLQKTVFEELGIKACDSVQVLDGDCVVYPKRYFCPKDPSSRVLETVPETYSVHHYEATWMSDEERRHNEVHEKYINEYSGRYPERRANIKAEYNTQKEMYGTRKAVSWFMAEALNKILKK